MSLHMSPQAWMLRLSHWDRARLHGAGLIGWRKGAGEQRAEFMTTHPPKVGPSNYGKAKTVAKKILAGEYPSDLSVTDIAEKERVTVAAVRTAMYKIRDAEAANEPKRRAAS